MKTKLASNITLAAVGITVLLTLTSAAHAQQGDGTRAPHRRSWPATDGTTTMMADGQAGTMAPVTARPVVNINTATVEQLAYLPGVGPKTAAAIIAARPYKAATEIERAKGIGKVKAARLAQFVTANGRTTATGEIKAAAGGAK
jgi:DNA uptake protein ComE-like DNA-binding protein